MLRLNCLKFGRDLTTTDFESNLFSFNTTRVLICDSKQIHTCLAFEVPDLVTQIVSTVRLSRYIFDH